MALNVVVIGAVALGPKAASRLKRLDSDATVTMIDQGSYISFGGCGIPYYVSGEVNSLDALRSTTYGTIRDPQYFADRGITVLNETRVTHIDRAAHRVETEHVQTGEKKSFPYDKLVIGTGSIARLPRIDGLDLENVHTATSLESAKAIRDACATGAVNRAVVVGGGFIGLEMAVALVDMWGIETTLVELTDQLLPGVVSDDVSDMAKHDLLSHQVRVLTGERVECLQGDQGKVSRVVTNERELDADLVIFATGFVPNNALAKGADLAVDEKSGGILVDAFMRTEDPDIYAGGDCVAVKHLLTERPVCLQLGSLANRQGRVIGTNLAGGSARFEGAVGSWAIKLFDISICGVGLTEQGAKAVGFDVVSVQVEQLDRAHFYPDKAMMSLELIVDLQSRRVLGLQGASTNGDAIKARIDAVATMLQFAKPTIDDVANAELAYAPPFSGALDTLNVVANVADNVLAKRLHKLSSREFAKAWNERNEHPAFFADIRPKAAAEAMAAKYPDEWHALPLEDLIQGDVEGKLATLPKDQPLLLICNTGLRSYEALLRLEKAGFKNCFSTTGGMQTMLKRGQAF